jgi:SAM-dependent methyltransferase
VNRAFKRVVETGYDRVAELYLASKDAGDPTTLAALEELAQRNVRATRFIKADMTDLSFAPEAFEAVVAFHSIIHVPRSEHPGLLERIHSWLRPGGGFLATWAVGEWEGEESDWEGWGAPMRWSHHDGETSLALLRAAGFEVKSAEVRPTRGTRGGESWLWVLARKPL